MRTFAALAFLLPVVAANLSVRGQTLPSASELMIRPPEEQLRAELDELLRVGISRPYGLGWTQVPETSKSNPVINYGQGATPAAGLILHLSGQLLGEKKYSDAAIQVARGLTFSMDPTGRVPAYATSLPGNLAQKETYGQSPQRGPTFAATGFLVLLDKQTASGDSRVTSGAVRASNWIVKQQIKPGHFPSSVDVPGQRYPKRVIRLDVPDTRDGLLTFLLVQRVGAEMGETTSLPVSLARVGAQRSVEQLLRLRINEVGKQSRYLWPAACDFDATLIGGIPSLPPAGNTLATRYALQGLVAYYLEVGAQDVFDQVKVTAEEMAARKDPDGYWFEIDDPTGRFAPPSPTGAPTWPRGDWGLGKTLTTIADIRVLGQTSFTKLTARNLPLDVTYAAMLTGLTDQLPTADLPLTTSQVGAYLQQHPETFNPLKGPEPVDLTQRVRRLWALYLLTSWERKFSNVPVGPR